MTGEQKNIETAPEVQGPGVVRPEFVKHSPRARNGYVRKPVVDAKVPQIEDRNEEDSIFRRNRGAFIFGSVVIAGVAWLFVSKPFSGTEPTRKAPEQQVVRIQLPPLPLPPPPKIQPPPPKDEKPVEQAPLAAPDKKPEPARPKPEDKPPEGLGTNIKGPGGNGDLSAGGGNGMIGGGGTGGRGGSIGAWYAGQVQTKVTEALRKNSKTRNASVKGLRFSVSLDGTGRIVGARLASSTGDAALDETIKNEILTGLQIQEAPPGGKPMSVTMVLNARRPNQ